MVVLVDMTCLDTCAFRGVTEYIPAALGIGWDISEGSLFPAIWSDGSRGNVALSAPRITVTLQLHLRALRLPGHYTMQSFRVEGSLRKS